MKIEYPKGETVWVSYYSGHGGHDLRYIITSKAARDYYFLYEYTDGMFKKLGRAKSPTILEDKFEIRKNLTRKKTK